MLLPGLDVRYVGLSTHANSLASEAIAFLLCLWHKPYSARWLNSLAWTLGCASLLLTQSKTNWISFVLCAFCMAYFRPEGYFRLWLSDFRRSLVPTSVLMIGMLTAGAIGLALMVSGIAGKMEAVLADAQARSNLLTLVGRTQIWEVALDEWRNNPLFGYGLMIWKEEHRAQFSMHIVSAHNQFYESLASAGIVGVAGLVIYAATLLWFVVKTTRASKGLSLALFLLLSIRSITEVTLSMEAFSAQMMHLLLLMVVAAAIASRSSARIGGMVPANAGGRPFAKYGS
jgi:O-antigen ligase